MITHERALKFFMCYQTIIVHNTLDTDRIISFIINWYHERNLQKTTYLMRRH